MDLTSDKLTPAHSLLAGHLVQNNGTKYQQENHHNITCSIDETTDMVLLHNHIFSQQLSTLLDQVGQDSLQRRESLDSIHSLDQCNIGASWQHFYKPYD